MAKRKSKKGASNSVVSFIFIICAALVVLSLSYLYPKLTGKDIFNENTTPCVTLSSASLDPDTSFSIHYINVGQGDAELIVAPTGEVMLIDAGPNSAETALKTYLDKLGIKAIDYAVFTHPHEDHIGGADMVLKNYQVKNVILPDVTTNTATYEKMLTAIDESGASVILSKVGNQYSLGTAQFTILGPETIIKDDMNNCSVVLRLDIGQRKFLFTGDCEKKEEAELLEKLGASPFRADVLKVGHHGSSTGTSDAFLSAVSPSYAVILCATGNDYGHPHKETLDRLNAAGVTVLRTDLQGSIVIHCDGNSLS